jgi:hypothetical protein
MTDVFGPGVTRSPRRSAMTSLTPRRRSSLIIESTRLPCWEYLSNNGVVAQRCTRCVVYQVRGTQCLQMADLETESGHARQFCQNSCEDCVYYRRVLGLPTNVLVITSDEALLERLSTEQDDRLALRFARNAYEASAVVQSFQAAFVVVDQELLTTGEGELLDSLAADPSLPGVKIVVGMRQGAATAPGEQGHRTPVFSVIEKPFGLERIASVVDSFPIERSTRRDLSVGV